MARLLCPFLDSDHHILPGLFLAVKHNTAPKFSEMRFHLLNPEIIAVSRLVPPLCSKIFHRSSHLRRHRDSQLFGLVLSFCASVSTLPRSPYISPVSRDICPSSSVPQRCHPRIPAAEATRSTPGKMKPLSNSLRPNALPIAVNRLIKDPRR